MNFWRVEIRCPICRRAFSSYNSIFKHLRHHHSSMSEQKAAATDPPAPVSPPEKGASISDERKDLLPWPIKTRKRSSNSRALVAVKVAGEPSNPPPLEKTGMELAISTLGSWDMMDLPLMKRILMVVRARRQNQFICIICGKTFASSRALGGHKAHHKIKENKSRASMKQEANKKDCLEAGDIRVVVVHKPPKPQRRSCGGARQCPRCDRVFSTPQGLGGHHRHCKGPPAPAESDTRAIQHFDLNKLPQTEGEEEMLALPWYDRDENGAPQDI